MAITVSLSTNPDSWTAPDSNDYIVYGLGGNDVIRTNGGNDFLIGGTGDDTMAGGLGNDTYQVDSAGDVVVESVGAGTDTVQSSVSYTLSANVENLTLTGTATSGTGNDLANVLVGNSAGNVLDGGLGADTMRGGLGDDRYVVDNAGDVVVENAGEGTDWVFSGISYALGANLENLWLTGSAATNGTGNAGANILQGNDADNVLDGQLGADTMYGGAGNDTFVVEHTGDVVSENAAGGTDTVRSNLASYTLGANVENLVLNEARTLVNGLFLVNVAAGVGGTGNDLANTITGNSVANGLAGGAGNDLLMGGGGNDWIDGGTGNDHMAGGTGNDTFVIDSAGDSAVEFAGEGTDTVHSSISYTLQVNLENLTLDGSASINGTGNDLANRIEGNFGNNVLNGGAGADILIGSYGDDIFIVDNAGDQVTDVTLSSELLVEQGGIDHVISSVSYTIAEDYIENLSLSGSTAVSATGNASANTLNGNTANNVLLGLAGNDVLRGGGGNDVMQGGSGADVLYGGIGSDVLRAVDNVAGVDDGAEDRFVFDAALSATTNVDQIDKATFKAGFEGTDDEIVLSSALFSALKSTAGTATGALGSGYYFEGAGFDGQGIFAPVGLYLDTTTGNLTYNATYGTANDSVLFAVVNNGITGTSASLSVEEFVLV